MNGLVKTMDDGNGGKAIEALKEQIDIEAEQVERDLTDNTPENTGGLKASL
jgi:hypothetical protein